LRDAIDGRNGESSIVFGARLVEIAFLFVDLPAAVVGGGVGRVDLGGPIILLQRGVEIALILVNVGAVIVAFDVVGFEPDRDAVIGERGVEIALLFLPARARAIDRGEPFVLVTAGIDHTAAGREPDVEFPGVLVIFVTEREARHAVAFGIGERRRGGQGGQRKERGKRHETAHRCPLVMDETSSMIGRPPSSVEMAFTAPRFRGCP
jgi:hypothetical protein